MFLKYVVIPKKKIRRLKSYMNLFSNLVGLIVLSSFFYWMKIGSYRRIIAIIIFTCLIFMRFQIDGGIFSIIGLVYLIITIIFSLYQEFRNIVLLARIDYTEPVMIIKKRLIWLKKTKIKTTLIACVMGPFSALGLIMMVNNDFFKGKMSGVSFDSLWFVIPIVLVFVISIIAIFKFTIKDRFRKLNQELREIEKLEGEVILQQTNRANQ